MVIQPRTDVFRNRILYFLTLILSLAVIVEALRSPQPLTLILGSAALVAIVLTLLQIYAIPKRSHALLIQREGDMIIATNVVHEGFKLRLLRDVLTEHVFSFSDEDRERFNILKA